MIDNWTITSAQWRLIEMAIISWLVYIIWSVLEWQIISFRWLEAAILTPLFAYLTKAKRDLESNDK